MDLKGLSHVVALARLLSFTKAAEEIGVSQPFLSRSIQAFEKREKVRLFDRDRGGVHVTPVGRAFAERAAALLRDAHELEQMLRRVSSGEEGDLSIGIAPLPARALLLGALSDNLIERDGLNIYVAIRNFDALIPMLASEKIECFVSAELPLSEVGSFRSSFLGYFPIVPLVRAGHPLLTGDAPDRPYRLASSGTMSHPGYVPPFLEPHIQTSARLTIEDYETLSSITARSDVIWITSPFTAREALSKGDLVELSRPNDAPPMRMRVMLYSLDRRSLSPAALTLRDSLRAEIQRLSGASLIANQSNAD